MIFHHYLRLKEISSTMQAIAKTSYINIMTNNSDAIIINDNAIGFFVPNIGNVYKKVPEYDNKENINDLIKMIINYSKDDNRSIISFKKHISI